LKKKDFKMDVEVIQKVAKALKVSDLGNISYNDGKIVTRSKGGKSVSGFTTILTQLSKEGKTFPIPQEAESRVQVLQWLDYTALFVTPAYSDKHTTNHLLRELNAYLQTKSYLAGSALSLADISVYFGLQSIMGNLTNLDKEEYIHLSRWFNHLQQNKEISQGNSAVNFSTIYLVGWSKGTHM